jgi:GT2 family glycosyltransferase
LAKATDRDQRITRVSVAIATWNRARLLDRTLEGFRALRIPPGIEWELIVVNNNCTDDTERVAATHAAALPVRHVIERRQGQSHARNCAQELATGDLICWTDDDVIVDPEWLTAYVEAATRWPHAGFFGGLIRPWFAHEPPAWLRENEGFLAGMLVARDLGPAERMFPRNEWPFGANMAFRRSAIAGHDFNPDLGLVGNNGIRRDETDYCRRLLDAGVEGVWVPSASVQHWVGPERMTLAYVRQYFEGYGRGKVREDGAGDGPRLFGAPRWLYRAYANAAISAAWRRALRKRDWIASFATAAELKGAIVESRAQRDAN